MTPQHRCFFPVIPASPAGIQQHPTPLRAPKSALATHPHQLLPTSPAPSVSRSSALSPPPLPTLDYPSPIVYSTCVTPTTPTPMPTDVLVPLLSPLLAALIRPSRRPHSPVIPASSAGTPRPDHSQLTPPPRQPRQPELTSPPNPSQPQPSSPTRQKKTRPSYLSPPPPDSRSRTPAQDSPHRPRNTSSTRAPRPSRARPRSVRRQGWPAQSPTQKKRAPPRLKSFLEKTLTRTNPPHFASQTTPPTHRPAPLILQGLRLIWRLYEAEAQGVMADLRGLGLDEHRS